VPHIVDQLIAQRAEALRQRPLLWQRLGPLRDMTLFRELLNKRGRTYRIHIGEPLIPAGIPGH